MFRLKTEGFGAKAFSVRKKGYKRLHFFESFGFQTGKGFYFISI